MDELSNFCQIIKNKLGDEDNLCIGQAREIVNSINNFLYSNYDGIGKTYAIENLLNTNDEAKHYLNDTDWLVIRHRDQLALGQTTSLTNEQYLDLLTKRQAARERVVEYGE